MDSNILYLNLFVIFILSLIIAATLITKKENLKARLSFCFFFLNIILVCCINLITFYFGNHKLIFVQITFGGLALLYGPMLLQYVFFSLNQKLPKYWSLNYWLVFIISLSGIYYLYIPESTQKQYLQEMIDGLHVPTILLSVLVLFHSIFYFIYVRIFLNKFKVDPNDIQMVIKEKWTSNFVNYMIVCNVTIIVFYLVAAVFYVELLIFADLVIVPIIILAIYSFIVIKSSQQHKEAEFKYVLSQVENQNKLLQQRLSISRDLHDNIGSQLTFIISSVDNVKYAFDIEDNHLENRLNKISEFAKGTIVELRDTVWALNSNKMVFEDLEARINNFIEKAKVSNEHVLFTFIIDEKLKLKELNAIEGMNVYRTIQEAIHNAFKHANASNITIEATESNGLKKIKITDDGIGFDMDQVEKGSGLNNMKKRIEQIGGKLELSSNKQGTTVEFVV